MAQTTQITIDNQTFPSFRSKLNESLSALNTLNSGTSRPSSAAAGTIWLDTTNATNPTLKFYDGADDISLATIDYSANTVNWLDSSVNLVSPVTISANDSAGAEIRLPEDTDNGSNYVGLKAADSIASNVTFTLPSADGTTGQALKTDGSGNLSFGDAGRLGTVNWDTTAKTAGFTAVSGNGYFVNTTSGAITMTLPSSPSAGDIVAVSDYANKFATNALTIARNGSNINGGAFDYESTTNGISLTFVYVDGTIGWKNVNDATTDATGQSNFIEATGGCITTCGDYKIHVFTSPATFCVSSAGSPCGSDTVDYLVVAGGGGGHGGGGGAGGVRASATTYTNTSPSSPRTACVAALPVSATAYPITVGAGGAAGSGNDGSNSTFSTITSAGGGAAARSGGSGGGGGAYSTPNTPTGGAGNSPATSPAQGSNGGNGSGPSAWASGGGGGFMVAGGNSGPDAAGSGAVAGNGGNGGGFPSDIALTNGQPSGCHQYFGGGGGGMGYGGGGSGGLGGGTSGASSFPAPARSDATANTGGAGGGHVNGGCSGAGGSGIVIIRYKFQ